MFATLVAISETCVAIHATPVAIHETGWPLKNLRIASGTFRIASGTFRTAFITKKMRCKYCRNVIYDVLVIYSEKKTALRQFRKA